MKRVFPLIVLLITLSVVGILFIQMSWIQNAISLKKEQFQHELENACTYTKNIVYGRFLIKSGYVITDDDSKQFILEKSFTSQYFTETEMQQILERALRSNNIRQPFEFCVTNIFNNPIMQSDGFSSQDVNSSYRVRLTPDNSVLGAETLYVSIKEDRNYVIREMAWMIVASIVFTTIIVLAFALTVRTLFNQRKLSEIKSDFINNMTHELKTPLATISLAIDALTNQKVIHDTDKIRYYSGMIKDENKRMNKQVEKILQAARIERQDIKLNLQHLDAHEIINKVKDNLTLQVKEKDGQLQLKLNAARYIVKADEVHFSNIIFNLLDNAIKYSKENLLIEIETFNPNHGTLAIKIKDNGIGMDKETQSRIFEKFYRAHTGNIHNVKGFGLGLSYAKAMIDEHGGKVKVESIPGKGSTFTVFMPLA